VIASFWSYLEDVERFFALVRASGFVLAPSDCEKVRVWYMKGVPLRVVLNGIVQGMRTFKYNARPDQRAPFHLNYYGKAIAAEVKKFRGGTDQSGCSLLPADETGGTPPKGGRRDGGSSAADPSCGLLPHAAEAVSLLLHLLSEADLSIEAEERELEREIKGRLRERLSELLEEVQQGTLESASVEHELLILDEEILSFYHGALDSGTQAELAKCAAKSAAAAGALGRKALEGARKAALERALRERLRGPVLVG